MCFVTVEREMPRMTEISHSVLPSLAQSRQSLSLVVITDRFPLDLGDKIRSMRPAAQFVTKASIPSRSESISGS